MQVFSEERPTEQSGVLNKQRPSKSTLLVSKTPFLHIIVPLCLPLPICLHSKSSIHYKLNSNPSWHLLYSLFLPLSVCIWVLLLYLYRAVTPSECSSRHFGYFLQRKDSDICDIGHLRPKCCCTSANRIVCSASTLKVTIAEVGTDLLMDPALASTSKHYQQKVDGLQSQHNFCLLLLIGVGYRWSKQKSTRLPRIDTGFQIQLRSVYFWKWSCAIRNSYVLVLGM